MTPSNFASGSTTATSLLHYCYYIAVATDTRTYSLQSYSQRLSLVLCSHYPNCQIPTAPVPNSYSTATKFLQCQHSKMRLLLCSHCHVRNYNYQSSGGASLLHNHVKQVVLQSFILELSLASTFVLPCSTYLHLYTSHMHE